MPVTPLPVLNETTLSSLPNYLGYVNNIAGDGWLGFSLLILCTGVPFLSLGSIPVSKRLLVALVFGSVASVFLTAMDLLASFFAPLLAVLAFFVYALTRESG